MTVERIRRFLDENDVHYRLARHPAAFTAQEVAAEAHVPGRHFAKVVTINVDDRLALAVLPATDQVDLERLARSLGAGSVSLATEAEFRRAFPDCEVGAMPPFGNLFGMETFVSRHLAASDEIAFNAGTHTEVMYVPWSDFERLVEPVIIGF
jgi:Ala-tRNA(Pro) deacylase